MTTNNLIVMDNSIVTSAYHLTLNEQRLIYCALKQMPKGEVIDPATPFYITRQDFIELGADPSNVAQEIRQATRDLLKKTIIIKVPTGELELHWLRQVLRYDREAEKKLKEQYPNPEDYDEYIRMLKFYNLLDGLPPYKADADIVARLIFTPEIIPLLSDLRSNFTQFLASDVSDFASIYSFRIYQLLMKFKSTGYVKISLDELKRMLMVTNKYPLVADFKRRAIDVAIREIDEKSPYKIISYELLKTGRRFTDLEVKFELKDKTKNNQLEYTPPADQAPAPDDSDDDIFAGLSEIEIKVISASADDYIAHKESVQREELGEQHKRNIYRKAVAERWGMADYEAKQKAEQRREKARELQRQKELEELKAEQERQDKSKQEILELAEIFESLDVESQQAVQGAVREQLASVLIPIFDKNIGKAHTNPMFQKYFRDVMGL